ncbi:MAG TPA: hypothetical protein VN285_00670, partial [Candidatus Deferrimicrobium sp.]|nr:hypothetical protein [Candidatus Deferrimicrobium sp.]
MSYTNVDLVRDHLVATFPAQDKVHDQAVILESDYVVFFDGPVEASTLIVKSIQSTMPTRVTVTLGSGATSLSASPVARGTVVVASDSSLGVVYTPNKDYIINYAEGDLVIKAGSLLSVGQTVTAWFKSYILYAVDADYQLDANRGRLKRLASGDIAAGETVYLDYSPIFQSFTEELLVKAVLETNGLVEKEVDSSGQFGADPVLQAGATYQALEIICRASAARELASLRGEDRTAMAWMKLADAY